MCLDVLLLGREQSAKVAGFSRQRIRKAARFLTRRLAEDNWNPLLLQTVGGKVNFS